MREILLRIYRTHDYDLMMLHYSKRIHIGHAAQQAVTAYYKGEYFRYQVQGTQKYEGRLPSQTSFRLVFKETEAPGIMDWLSGFTDGCRNSFIKNILRTYLDCPLGTLYRPDMWQPYERSYSSESVIPPVFALKRGRPKESSVPRRNSEKNSKNITPNRRPPSGSRLVGEASQAGRCQSTKTVAPHAMPDHTTEDKSKPIIKDAAIPDSGFDAFSMFNQLRNGE